MAMQYLIQRDDEYRARLDDFEKQLGEAMDLMRIIQYNIVEMKEVFHSLRTTDADDVKLKEAFHAKRQGTV